MASAANSAGGRAGNSRLVILLLITSGCFVTGLLFDYMPTIVDDHIKRVVELATNEEIRSIWSRPPVEFDSYFWLYDVLNADKFMAGDRIRVKKVGPFHFTSRPEKRLLELSANKYRLRYNSTRLFAIDELAGPPSANRRLDAPLVLLNPVLASMVEGARELVPLVEPAARGQVFAGVNRMAERFNETLLMNTTAREALLGRRVKLLGVARKMAATFGLALNLPDALPDDLFGYVAALNATPSGPFEIYTGFQATMGALGELISYRGRRRLTEYRGKCNRLQASAGELRPMPVRVGQTLEMFAPNLCRIVHLQPTGSRKTREGLALSYMLAPEDFASAQLNPDNRCFCVNGTRDDYCSLHGAIELAPCSYFAPLVLTMPHVAPDRRILDSIEEFEPELLDSSVESKPPANASSQVLILRRLGIPIQADITVTLFMKVTRDAQFRQTASVPEISYVPLMMAREFVVVPPKLAQIIVNLESFLALTYHIRVVMYLSGIVLLCWLTGHYYTRSGVARHRSDRVVPGPSASGSHAEPTAAAAPQPDPTEPEGRGSGPGGRGPRAAAQPAGVDSLSERANSQDSSRSQPPSRASRNSAELADQQMRSPDDQQAGAEHQQPTASEPPSRHQRDDPGAGSGLDKADELEPQVSGAATNNNSDGATRQADGQPSDGGRADAGKRRNWFVKVCASFVRMLDELRASIKETGQLDLAENDYQDRQLEMLAGKIDNWYASNSRDAATASPSPHEPEASADLSSGLRSPTPTQRPQLARAKWQPEEHAGELDARSSTERDESALISAPDDEQPLRSSAGAIGAAGTPSGPISAQRQQHQQLEAQSPVANPTSGANQSAGGQPATSASGANQGGAGPIGGESVATPALLRAQIDESPSTRAQSDQSNDAQLGQKDAHQRLGANGSSTSAIGRIASAGKDERRDSGVKLELRNGIGSDPIGEPTSVSANPIRKTAAASDSSSAVESGAASGGGDFIGDAETAAANSEGNLLRKFNVAIAS